MASTFPSARRTSVSFTPAISSAPRRRIPRGSTSPTSRPWPCSRPCCGIAPHSIGGLVHPLGQTLQRWDIRNPAADRRDIVGHVVEATPQQVDAALALAAEAAAGWQATLPTIPGRLPAARRRPAGGAHAGAGGLNRPGSGASPCPTPLPRCARPWISCAIIGPKCRGFYNTAHAHWGR